MFRFFLFSITIGTWDAETEGVLALLLLFASISAPILLSARANAGF